jgi:nucleotide-binding universal stress UspA family protein
VPTTAETGPQGRRAEITRFPYRHIACAVDGAPVSALAADEAARLTRFGAERLTYLYALESAVIVGSYPDDYAVPSSQVALVERARDWLNGVAAEHGGDAQLVTGYPPAAIAEWSDANAADLLIAGAHRGLVDRMFLGGFAAYLAGHAACSVLLIRADRRPAGDGEVPFRHIAVCVDDSEPSRRSLNEAVRLARLGAETLSIVHVLPWPPSHLTMGYALVPDPTTTFSDSQEWLNDLVAATGIGVPVLLKGDPPRAVSAWAREAAPDVLICAAHRGLWERVLLGSFATYVAYHAPCDVLLTRAHTERASAPAAVAPA